MVRVGRSNLSCWVHKDGLAYLEWTMTALVYCLAMIAGYHLQVAK